MGLLDLFNQWIVERGSATVQEKHIALFRDQLALADKRITELESEIASLKSKLKNSQTTINQLIKEKAELKKKNQVPEKPSHSAPSLDESQVRILIYLSSKHDAMFPLESIMAVCKLSEQKALFHLEELEDAYMIESTYHEDITHWYLTQDGRRYLHEHDLLV